MYALEALAGPHMVLTSAQGAIVVFCAPGTIVSGNIIIARGRDLLGGINMFVCASLLVCQTPGTDAEVPQGLTISHLTATTPKQK